MGRIALRICDPNSIEKRSTMFEHTEQEPVALHDNDQRSAPEVVGFFELPSESATTEQQPSSEENGTVVANGETLNRHIEAGRKGAQRYHHLIQLGKLYEQEH